jgi:hypothetical protein
MPMPLFEASTPSQERSVLIRRNLAALAGVIAVTAAGTFSIHEGRELVRENRAVSTLERPYDTVKNEEFDGKIEGVEVVDVPVLEQHSAFEEAQRIAKDDIDVGDLPKVISKQVGSEVTSPDEHVIVPADMVDPEALLPNDKNIHVG